MTHNYLLIVAGPQLDDTTKFYKVGVGCSKQANRDFLYLTALAAERNYYFKLWTQEVADFFHRVVKSIYHIPDNVMMTIPNYDYVTARDIVRHFKEMDAISRSGQNLAQRDHFLKSLNLNYRIISNLRKK